MEDDASQLSATDQGSTEAKPEDPFSVLARDFLLTNIDPSKKEAACRDLTIRLVKIASTVQELFVGEKTYSRPSKQPRHLASISKLCARLLNQLNSLDPRNALSLMGELEGRPVSIDDDGLEGSVPLSTVTDGMTGVRLAEYEWFQGRLFLARDNALLRSQAKESNRRGAPKISEAAIVGIANLAQLWRECRWTEVSSSRNDGQFGSFALRFFRLLRVIKGGSKERLFETDAQVRTALRRYVENVMTGSRNLPGGDDDLPKPGQA